MPCYTFSERSKFVVFKIHKSAWKNDHEEEQEVIQKWRNWSLWKN